MLPVKTCLFAFLVMTCLVASEFASAKVLNGQGTDRPTPLQREIERQRERLNSAEVEDRRDALMRLGNLHRPQASRTAAPALNDLVPSVRVAAAHAVLSLPPDEAAGLLLPLLGDKLEFVRREAAYALGKTRSRAAVAQLANLLLTDKEPGVRGAAAVALGEIGDESAVKALSQVLVGSNESGKKKKKKTAEDEFVMRTAAHSLGQIRNRSAVGVLIATLENEANANDVRREAAIALGLLGDPSAAPALRAAFASGDPYLSEAARAALKQLSAGRN